MKSRIGTNIARKPVCLVMGMSSVSTYKGYKICQYSSEGLQHSSQRFKVYQGDTLVATYLLGERKWLEGVNKLSNNDASAIEQWVEAAFDELMANVALTDKFEKPLDIHIPVSKSDRKKYYKDLDGE